MAFQIEDGFVFALTYGKKVDWVRNILVYNNGVLLYRGEEYKLHSISHASYDAVKDTFPYFVRMTLGILSVKNCIIVRSTPT